MESNPQVWQAGEVDDKPLEPPTSIEEDLYETPDNENNNKLEGEDR